MPRIGAKLRVLSVFVLCSCATAGGTGGRSGGGGDDDDGSGGDSDSGSGGSQVTSSASGMGTGGDSSGTLGIGGGGSGNVCDVAAMQESDATCKVAISVDKFMISSQSCFVDSPLVNGTSGEFSFACGDGPATLTFPSYVFTGKNSACQLDLLLQTQFVFSDGCTWQSTQTIVGPMDGNLSYSYMEAPISGSVCATPCTMEGTLLLEQASPVDVEPPK
jgi:hypothetical protein